MVEIAIYNVPLLKILVSLSGKLFAIDTETILINLLLPIDLTSSSIPPYKHFRQKKL